MNISCHEAACEYLERGWSAAAFCPPDHLGCGHEHAKRCESPGKRPLGDWKGLQFRLAPRWLLDLSFKNHPNANVGIILGTVSKLVGVDLDGVTSRDFLRTLVGQHQITPTLCFRTGQGWRLLYGLADGEEPPPSRQIWSRDQSEGRVEILSQGRCTVMPPSLHVSGRRYTWIPGHGLHERELAPCPSWLYRLAVQTPNRVPYEATDESKPITNCRTPRLFRLGCAMRRHGLNREEINECLLIVNRRCVPPLPEKEVHRIACNASRYNPAVV